MRLVYRLAVTVVALVGIVLSSGCSFARQERVINTPLTQQAVAAPTQQPELPAAATRAADLTLVPVTVAPLISKAEALQIVRDKIPAPVVHNNDPVVAMYGLATFGKPGEVGKPWLGDRNIPLPTGEVLDHIENRPMWILDFGNIPGGISSRADSGHNHVVYAVDAQTRAILLIWSYAGL